MVIMINYLQSISLSTKSFPSFNICRGEEITGSLLNNSLFLKIRESTDMLRNAQNGKVLGVGVSILYGRLNGDTR